MEPLARPQATLVDLLDRVLDRGVVLDADVIISLSGVPLLGIKLRAALAGMETMLKYGMFNEQDERSPWRRQALVDVPVVPDETLAASQQAERGIACHEP